MRFLVFLGGLITALTVAASPVSPLPTCQGVNVHYLKQSVVLNTDKAVQHSRIFIFQNTSQQNLWLDHPVAHPSASAGWSSQLTAQHWSALVLTPDKSNFVIKCEQIQPGKIIAVSCQQHIKVCQLQNVVVENKDASFWAAENLLHDDLFAHLKQRKLISEVSAAH